jgi:hypothetical protein
MGLYCLQRKSKQLVSNSPLSSVGRAADSY